jgi:hypothetical protein
MPWSGMQPVTACSVHPRHTVLVVGGIQTTICCVGMWYVMHA